jgi:glycosyltransferase involved in cell wall biosynthesis
LEYKLSILIPTISSRTGVFKKTYDLLNRQIFDCNAFSQVEIVVDCDNRETPTGEKRNRLIEKAKGKYIVCFDDDDEPLEGYIKLILEAIELNPDVIPLNGYMTTNGHNPVYWDMGLNFGYGTKQVNGVLVYDRFPNHIAVMKRELILPYRFLPIVVGEDYEWAKRINDDKVFKTEVRITEPIYHYKFIENK